MLGRRGNANKRASAKNQLIFTMALMPIAYLQLIFHKYACISSKLTAHVILYLQQPQACLQL